MELTRIRIVLRCHNLMEYVLQRGLSVPEASRHAHDDGHLIEKLRLIMLV